MRLAERPPRLREPAASGRAIAAVMITALALHAAVLGWWFADLLQRSDVPLLPARELMPLLACVVLAAAAIFAAPHRARQVVAVIVGFAACALVGPGAVATVALMTLSAHVIGGAALRFAAEAFRGAAPIASPSAGSRMLVGATLWMALIGATIVWPVHIAPIHVLFLIGSLLVAPGRTRESLAVAWRWLSVDDAPSRTERIWIAVAAGIAVMHVVLAARPEVGYDANAMHLQFAELVAHDRRWSFDVGRYAWAAMPMGADHAYLSAYLFGGEPAARLVNLAFGALLAATVFATIRREASREVALASVCLLASTPLWLLESGTLYVEFAWTALLVAGLAATLDFAERGAPVDFAAAALCLAGAMQCKAIGVFWVAPVAIALLVCALGTRRALAAPPPQAHAGLRERKPLGARIGAVGALALLVGAWPYANAWLRTGNPVFPFLNDVFRSPLFDSTTPFNNALYNTPFSWSTPYDLVLSSGRYIEGSDGAAGVQWLLLYPLVAMGLLARPTRLRLLLLALAVGFGLAVYLQQSYLRYLLPAFVLLAIVGGWILGDWVRSGRAKAGLLAAGGTLVVINVSLMPASGWSNATLCLDCGFDTRSRNAYVASYAPLRLVADYLNRNLPNARVGFLVFNAPAPSGFVGYSRAANWHDTQAFPALRKAATVDDIAAIVRRFRLTHAVFVDRDDPLDEQLRAYRDRRTVTVVRIGNYIVAEILPHPP